MNPVVHTLRYLEAPEELELGKMPRACAELKLPTTQCSVGIKLDVMTIEILSNPTLLHRRESVGCARR